MIFISGSSINNQCDICKTIYNFIYAQRIMIIVNSIFPVLYGTSDFIKTHFVSSVWADLPSVCDSICAQFVSSVRADLLLLDLINPVEMNTYMMLPSEVSSL